MTTTDQQTDNLQQVRFPTAPAEFDVTCPVDEALRRLALAVRRSTSIRRGDSGLVGLASRDDVRVRWYSGRPMYLPVVFDGHFTERPGGLVLEGHYRHARRTKVVCNFVLGLCVLVLVFGIMGVALPWLVGSGALADRWLSTLILLPLMGVSALVLVKGQLRLRREECDELSAAIRNALHVPVAS